MATDPLLTTGELETWAQLPVGQLAADAFAMVIIAAASLIVREAGSMHWTRVTPVVEPDLAVPQRAQLIATLKAKTYILNPTSNISEGTGPLSERKIDEVVHNMRLTLEEELILANLAGEDGITPAGGGLWVQPTLMGDGLALDDDFYVTDSEFASDWEIPFARLGDNLYPQL